VRKTGSPIGKKKGNKGEGRRKGLLWHFTYVALLQKAKTCLCNDGNPKLIVYM